MEHNLTIGALVDTQKTLSDAHKVLAKIHSDLAIEFSTDKPTSCLRPVFLDLESAIRSIGYTVEFLATKEKTI